jgi:eukaryotic-like serine/threonine-protein kinase
MVVRLNQVMNNNNQTRNQEPGPEVNQGMGQNPQGAGIIWPPNDVLHTPAGQYTIKEILGQGGFGITYLVTDKHNDNYVIKTLNATAQNHIFVEKIKQDLRDEAKTLAEIDIRKSPNIVKIEKWTEFENLPLVIMEYIEGKDLGNQHLAPSVAIKYIRKIAESLIQVHENKVIHRDIKPANIIIRTLTDDPILVDFGTARNFDKNTQLTGFHSGYFTAPEQLHCQKQGPYTDIYSLGVTLYALITGENNPDIDHLKFPDNIRISKKLEKAINHAIAPLSENRPQTIEEWLKELPTAEEESNLIIAQKNIISSGTTTIIQPVKTSKNNDIFSLLKNILFIVTPLLLIVVLFAYINQQKIAVTPNPPTEKQKPLIKTNTFIDKKNGFTIKYPEQWGTKDAKKLQYDGRFKTEALELLPPFQEITSDKSKVYSRVVVEIKPNNKQSLDDIYNQAIENIPKFLKNGHIISHESIKINNIQAYKIVFTGEENQDVTKKIQFLLIGGEDQYVITYEAPTSQFNEFERESMEIMESFKKLEP